MEWLKRHTGTLAVVEFVIIIGLATSTTLLAVSKNHATSPAQVSSQQTAATTQTATTAYKLGTCKSGTTQTVGNGDYLVGTDIAPGSYKVDSQTNDTGYTTITIYSSKSQYDQAINPNSTQYGASNQSFMADYGKPTTTKLSDGQYMDVSDDSAVFTCQ